MIGQQVVENAFRNLGGTASLRDIYDWLENHGNLTEWELGASPHGGRPRYQHGVRSHISDMVQAGKAERVGAGLYRLSK